MRSLIFKVLDRESGHVYQVFDDATLEGFPNGSVGFNYHPNLVASAIAQLSEANGINGFEPPELHIGATSERFGATHSIPPAPTITLEPIRTSAGEKK